jgi:hypothetical protein
MRRMVIGALCLLVALSVATTAGAKIRITKIQYNPPGKDTGSNDSLNGEWVMIKNTATRDKTVHKWKLRDAQGHVYKFGLSFTFPAGLSWKIHTGSGLDSFPTSTDPGDLYYGSSSYIWNNDKDTAILKSGSGAVVDRCHYNNPSRSSKLC